jgi:hypothetical protein
MLIRTIALLGLLFAFSSRVAFATDDDIVILDEEHMKCSVKHNFCVAGCNWSDRCSLQCDLDYIACTEKAEDDAGVRRADTAILTGASLCLDVHAPDIGNNGGRVQAWACNGARQQRWTYDAAAHAVRAASGLCLDVHAPEAATNGGRVQVWACNGQPQQQWTPGANRSLRNARGLCLDVHAADQASNGARVQVWQCNGSRQQRFLSRAFADPKGPTFSKPGGANSSGN